MRRLWISPGLVGLLRRALDRRKYRKDLALARDLYMTGHPMLAELVFNGGRFAQYRYPPLLTVPSDSGSDEKRHHHGDPAPNQQHTYHAPEAHPGDVR